MSKARRGRKTIALEKYIKEKLGIDACVWYEPISGPCIEMQGYAGGWYYYDKDILDDGQDCVYDVGDPIGYNLKEAMEHIDITARLKCYD